MRLTMPLSIRAYEGSADALLIARMLDDSRKASGRNAPPLQQEKVEQFVENVNADWNPRRDFHLFFLNEKLVAYGRTKREHWASGALACYVEPMVHAGWRTPEVFAAVIEHLCAHQARVASEARRKGDAFLTASFIPEDAVTRDAFVAAGFSPCRVFLKMERSLDSKVAAGSLSDDLELRPLDDEHHRAIYDFDREIMRNHWGIEAPSEEHFRWWSEEAFLNPELWCVAWHGDRIVGMAAGSIGGTWNTDLGGDRGEIRFVRVAPEWRRCGIASELIRRCLSALYEKGIRHVELSVDGENETSASTVYRSLGFEVTSCVRAYRRDFE